MTYSNRLLKIMLVVICFYMILSIPCVFAYWQFSNEEQIIGDTTVFDIAYFPWIGEDILPDEGEEDVTTQLDGLQIILNALNNEGLSAGTQSKLNRYISKRLKNFNKFEYGSVDIKQDPKELFSDVTTINPNFEFILQGIITGSGNNASISYFYLYMIDMVAYNSTMELWNTAVSNGKITIEDYENNNSLFNEYFQPVYRVIIEKNVYNKWEASIAQVGYTGFGYYEGSNNGGAQKSWTFEPSSWVEVS